MRNNDIIKNVFVSPTLLLAFSVIACGGEIDSDPRPDDGRIETSGMKDGIIGKSKCTELGGKIVTNSTYTSYCKQLGGTGEVCQYCSYASTPTPSTCETSYVCVR